MNPENENVEVNENEDYIRTIQELKANTVDKDKYDKLKAENKQLLQTLVEGGQLEQPVVERADIAALRKELFKNEHLTNLEYCEKALELRDILMEQGERDPFLPFGSHANVTDQDYAAAEKVAQNLRECIDISEGDPQIFTRELQRRMTDTMPIRR